jgi:hypothetical protein
LVLAQLVLEQVELELMLMAQVLRGVVAQLVAAVSEGAELVAAQLVAQATVSQAPGGLWHLTIPQRKVHQRTTRKRLLPTCQGASINKMSLSMRTLY